MGNDPIPIGCSAIKPVERKGMEAFSWFLYDKNTGAIMGRTPLSWLLITIFYIVYYAFLAGFWALMLIAFFQFIDDKEPRWQQEESRIGRSPALGVRPGQTWDYIDSSMIIFNKETDKDVKYKVPGYTGWVDRTNKFLAEYKQAPPNGIDCGAKAADQTSDPYNNFCKFSLSNLGDCSGAKAGEANFGYDKGEPCILLKLNRIYGLEPEYYTSADPENEAGIPAEAPQEVKDRITAATNKKQIWVSCKGENAADEESMGDITYFPSDAAFPGYYFPYLNQPDYQSPVVAVKFKGTKVGQFIHVECRAWAGNIKYDKRDRAGIAHFELMVHDAKTASKVVM